MRRRITGAICAHLTTLRFCGHLAGSLQSVPLTPLLLSLSSQLHVWAILTAFHCASCVNRFRVSVPALFAHVVLEFRSFAFDGIALRRFFADLAEFA